MNDDGGCESRPDTVDEALKKDSDLATRLADKHVDRLRQNLEHFDSDVEHNKRKEISECKRCFYLRVGTVVGHSFTDFICRGCAVRFSHPNTATGREASARAPRSWMRRQILASEHGGAEIVRRVRCQKSDMSTMPRLRVNGLPSRGSLIVAKSGIREPCGMSENSVFPLVYSVGPHVVVDAYIHRTNGTFVVVLFALDLGQIVYVFWAGVDRTAHARELFHSYFNVLITCD